MMKCARAGAAALLVLALAGCQPSTGAPAPPTVETPLASPGPSASGLAAIIQTAVEDRNGTVLETPPALRLSDGHTTPAYRAKRDRDAPVVAQAKARFKSFGFWYTSFSTTVTVESVETKAAEASVHFKELTEQYQASAADGPSSVPESYSLPQIATFRTSAEGWKLDSIAPLVRGSGLPMSIVDG